MKTKTNIELARQFGIRISAYARIRMEEDAQQAPLTPAKIQAVASLAGMSRCNSCSQDGCVGAINCPHRK